MAKLKVMNGTPVGNEHLCRGCSHCQFTTGYRETDVLVLCTNPSPALLIPFPVRECTDFWDRNRPDWSSMQKLALDFSEGHRKPTPGFRNRGFASVPVPLVDEEDGDDDEAALTR